MDEVDNVPAVKKSEPLLITTQPINDKTVEGVEAFEAMSEGPDKSCSTSFESNTDDSVLMIDTMAAVLRVDSSFTLECSLFTL